MKKLTYIFCILFLAAGLWAEDEAEPQKLRVGVMNGGSCIPTAYMMENNKTIMTSPLSWKNCSDSKSMVAQLLKNNIDVGFLPVNLAVTLFTFSNKEIICCGITENGSLSLLTNDPSIKTFQGLNNKTVGISKNSDVSNNVFKYLLEQNGLTVGKENNSGVELQYADTNSQVLSQLLKKQTDCAVLPEPYVTIARSKSTSSANQLSCQTEYQAFAGPDSVYPVTLMVVRKDFADKNPALLNQFLKNYESSYLWTIKNPMFAAKLGQKYKLGVSADIMEKAIPDQNYTFVTGKTAKKQIENLFAFNKDSSYQVELPSDDFYYQSE